MEDDILLFCKDGQEELFTQREDGGEGVVILTFKVTLQSWRHLMDILHHGSSGLSSSTL